MDDTYDSLKPLLDLFATTLADVRFADLDGQALNRALQETVAAEEALNAAQLVVETARARLQERQDALMAQAHRALAYAKVFAEPDAALSLQVSAIVLPRIGRRVRSTGEALVLSSDPAPDAAQGSRPRGRPRKVRPSEPALELSPPPAE